MSRLPALLYIFYCPWFLAPIVAIAGELVARRDDILSPVYWRRDASLHDNIITLFRPSTLRDAVKRSVLTPALTGIC